MTEQVSKYMTQNARVFCVFLSEAVARSAALNALSGADQSLLGKLEVFTAGIAALQKDEKATVTARLSLKESGIFSATADRDGKVRGLREGDFEGKEDMLEVTLQLHLRGNYTGMVTGSGLEDLMTAYFADSLQIAAVCQVFETEQGFFFLLSEQLPGAPCDLETICAAAREAFPKGEIPADFTFLESFPLAFGCTCSRGALLRFVSALSPEDRAELSEKGKIVTHCNSCGKKYTFEI